MSKQSSTNKQDFEQWLAKAGQNYQSFEQMPEWDREAALRNHFRPPNKVSWWTQPLAFASFALSCIAVSLVVVQSYRTDMEAKVDARVAAIVEQKLDVFAEQQKMRLAQQGKELRSDFREQLSTSTTQLATYILATNRQERKDDMQNLVEYVNDTRQEDISFYAQQLRRAELQNYPSNLENE